MVSEIVANASKYEGKLAVVTGGEPLIYDMSDLTQSLQQAGFQTHLETSGAYPLTGTWDWICFSPKKFKAPLQQVANDANELKVIIYNKSDFNWAEKHAATVGEKCWLFLQPEWSKQNSMMPQIIDYVKENPRWQISLQAHKFIGVP
jgi:organic radical activating enzyme